VQTPVFQVNIRRYDLEVTLRQRQNSHLYEIKVPGLAESRPSILRGDWIYAEPIDANMGSVEFQVCAILGCLGLAEGRGGAGGIFRN